MGVSGCGRSYAETGQAAAAEELVGHMQALGCRPNRRTFNILILAHARAHRWAPTAGRSRDFEVLNVVLVEALFCFRAGSSSPTGPDNGSS